MTLLHWPGYRLGAWKSCSGLRVLLSCGFPSAEQFRLPDITQVLITVVTRNAPRQICCLAVDDGGAVVGEHGAGPGDGLVGAAEPGRCVGGDHRVSLPRHAVAAVVFSTADHTDTDGYAPLFWRLAGVSTGRPVDNHRVVCALRIQRAAAGNGVPPPGTPCMARKDGHGKSDRPGQPARPDVLELRDIEIGFRQPTRPNAPTRRPNPTSIIAADQRRDGRHRDCPNPLRGNPR